MANHHHTSIQSIVEQYVPTEPSYHTPSSYRQPSVGTGYAAPARYTLGSGPPRVDADDSPVYSGYKRPSSEGLFIFLILDYCA
ncbi:hypothetical protein CTI12_AA049220 [Artemisia annua]|uniref:Uncharacterized protein n=1 Tax=Artemisia annua TaxID=35608 RepID=A0A2U1QC84_ARTAN|nr:hypothetical protein CTI12_AA049220 [Artemisia annua]